MGLPITVAESSVFIAHADRILGQEGREQLIEFLAENPEAGVIIPATGGLRKLRWIAPGRGKRGGTRVIYYFHSENIPLFALDIYTKNEKADLNSDEKKAWKAVVQNIVRNYRSGQ
jgi:hypothetical protein